MHAHPLKSKMRGDSGAGCRGHSFHTALGVKWDCSHTNTEQYNVLHSVGMKLSVAGWAVAAGAAKIAVWCKPGVLAFGWEKKGGL